MTAGLRLAAMSPVLLSAVSLAGEPPRLSSPSAQYPSPMVEYTRPHPRLKEERPAGTRITLKVGTLFVPESLPPGAAPLFVHFHGATWVPELAAAEHSCAVITVQLGSGSAAYAKPFTDPTAFSVLLDEAREMSGRDLDLKVLSAWSAGYGAVREILRVPEHYDRVPAVLLLDGLHCGYVKGTPGPLESDLVTEDVDVFVKFANDAAAGRKRLLPTHTEIFPGTFASTTETADHLLRELKLDRRAVLRWGPKGTQMLSEAGRGGFRLLGFAGNSAPDHVDLLHALPELLGEIDLGDADAPSDEETLIRSR